MAPSQKSSRHENGEESGEKLDPKRVSKACDRCRLKKSKCDGSRPCNRCKTDDGICMYGERKKLTEKIYPKGYCDQLVADHDRLIKCVHLLYEHCSDAKTKWAYPKVEKDTSGGYVTHNILKSMNLLQPVDNDDADKEPFEIFEDNPKALLKKLQVTEEIRRQQQVREEIREQPQVPAKPEPSTPAPIHATPMHRHLSMSRTPSRGLMQSGGHHATPMHRHISMSRTPSRGLMQPGGPYPTLDRSHQPNAITTTDLGQTPIGGYGPLTPAESPSKDEPFFGISMEDRGISRMSMLNQPIFGLPPQSFSSVAQAQGSYAHACRARHRPTNFGVTPFPYSSGQSAYMQGAGFPSAPMPHQRGAMGAGDLLASIVPNDESATTSITGIPDQDQVWSAASVPTATDPVLGFDPNSMQLLQEFGGVDFNGV